MDTGDRIQNNTENKTQHGMTADQESTIDIREGSTDGKSQSGQPAQRKESQLAATRFVRQINLDGSKQWCGPIAFFLIKFQK